MVRNRGSFLSFIVNERIHLAAKRGVRISPLLLLGGAREIEEGM